MEEFFINTPLRQAAFLAEVAFNTAELSDLEERGSDDTLEKLYGQRKELGNYQPGDGSRYKGRGAFMITGRSLYQSLSQRLGVDLVNRPELAATPDVAFRTAAFFWRSNGLNALADKSDLVSISRRINGGGAPSIERQRTYFEKAKIALGVAASEQ
jgi:predicted chitinase